MTRPKQQTHEPAAAPFDPRLRPWLLGGMTALLVARPLFPSESAAVYGDGLTMVMLWIALAVFWLLGAVGRRQFSICFGCIDAAVLLLVGWQTVSALWAVAHGTPRPAANMLWEWIGMGLCFLLARQLIATACEARALAAVMIALAVALSGYGLYQYVDELPNMRAEYAANPERAMRDAGLWFPPDAPERKLFADRLNSVEPLATFALTNSLAGYLAPWLVVLAGMGLAVAGSDSRDSRAAKQVLGATAGSSSSAENTAGQANRGTRRSRLTWRVLGLLICAIPIAVCLLLTKSRSGCIATGVGLVLAWLLCRGRAVRIGWKIPAAVIAATALLVAGAIAGGRLDREVLSQASRSFGFRLQYWQSSLQMIADHPIVGCGLGNFQNAYTQYKLPTASEEVADPHNFLLEIWATAGTPAVLAFLAVLGGFAWAVLRGEGRGDCPNFRVNENGTVPFDAETAPISTKIGTAPARGTRGGQEGLEIGDWALDRSAKPSPGASHPSSFILHPCANPKSLVPNPSWSIFAGGACGFLLSVPVGLLSAAPPGMTAVLLGLPAAAVAAWLMLGWVRDGRLPRLLPAIGVVVLLVNLSAAGGIALPSVAGTFWLLLALGLQGEPPRQLRVWVAWAALAAMIGMAAACYLTAYYPVLGCQAQLRWSEREPARAVEHLEAAAVADPLAAEPWRQLAAAEFDSWWQHPSADAFQRFQRADRRFLELAPNSAPAWLASGDWYALAYSKTDRRDEKRSAAAIREAVDAFRRAVRLYPNSATCRAKLAEASRAAGDQPGFRREAAEALRLDAATPHASQKLPDELRKNLTRGLDGL